MHGVSVPARMRLTADQLTEIRHAFRQRLAAERVPKKPPRRKRKPKPPSALVREPDYDDTTYSRPGSSLRCSRCPHAPCDAGLTPGRCRRFGRSAVSVASEGERFGAWSPDCLRAATTPARVSRLSSRKLFERVCDADEESPDIPFRPLLAVVIDLVGIA